MDFKQLRSFVAVADCGSFTQAAAQLYTSQPTISAHIRQLEEELQQRLFLRTTKSLSITPHGRELYDYAVQVLSLQDRLLAGWRQGEHVVSLGVSTIPSAYLLPDLLARFSVLHPDISFDIHQSDSSGVLRALRTGRFDLGLTGMTAPDEDLVFTPLYQDAMVLIAPNTPEFSAAKAQNMPLAAAGVVVGDLLVSINGAPITCVADFTAYQTEHPFDGSAVPLEYEHSGKTKEITVTPVENTYANVQFSYQLREKQSPIGVLKYSVLEIKYWVRTVIDSVSMLITGQYSVNDLSGPVGVVDAIGTAYDDVKSQGVLVTVMTMLNMVILLSSNLGVMNLLPLPALDGGRLVFLIIEAIRRKPIRRDLEGMVHFAGLVLLMALMVYVMIHDVQRIL